MGLSGAALAGSLYPNQGKPALTPWNQTIKTQSSGTSTCSKVGGTDSAPVCGGTCSNGQLCDISIGGDGKSYCQCS